MKKQATSGAALLLIAVLSGCSGAAEGASTGTASTTSTPRPTSTPTVTVTPKPSAMKTSGSYTADLAALGVVPDNIKSFATYMEEEICDQTGTGLGVSVRSIGGNETGGGIDGVRLTVAYFCPQKSLEVESYLDYFKK